MGLLQTFWGEENAPLEGNVDAATPLRVTLRFAPLRLTAMKSGRVDLLVQVQNTSNQLQLVSVDAMLARMHLLGFEPTCLNKSCETRVGEVQPGETKEVRVGVWGSNQTKAGDYPMEVHVYSHYLDYNKVINYVKKSTVLRVV